VAVIAQRSRFRAVTDKDQKTSRGNRIATRYPGANAPGSSRLSGPGQEASASPAILGVKADHGEREMKVREMLAKVYEPGRLQTAWQQRMPVQRGSTRWCSGMTLQSLSVSGLMGSATD
jgi:hypothetical protein